MKSVNRDIIVADLCYSAPRFCYTKKVPVALGYSPRVLILGAGLVGCEFANDFLKTSDESIYAFFLNTQTRTICGEIKLRNDCMEERFL